MKQSCLLLLLLLNVSSCAALPESIDVGLKIQETNSFNDVATLINQKAQLYGHNKVLVVVDIDNTLLTSESDLGGDIWYQWQRGSLEIKPREDQIVACLFEDSISLLYELGPMQLTEPELPQIISTWQDQSLTVFALTSRSPKYRAATERELLRAGIDLSKTALSPEGQKVPILRQSIPREMSYMQGIMMTSGMNKGLMLNYMLETMQQHFDAIIFVDDSQKNIDNLYEEYKTNSGLDMTLFHYTRIEEQRLLQNGKVLTQAQADLMAQQWSALSQLIVSIFPSRQQGVCLNSN
jgi:hypothetical protein